MPANTSDGLEGARPLPRCNSFKELLGCIPRITHHLNSLRDPKLQENIGGAYCNMVRGEAKRLLRPEWGLSEVPERRRDHHPSYDLQTPFPKWLRMAVTLEEMVWAWDYQPLAQYAWGNQRIHTPFIQPGETHESKRIVSDPSAFANYEFRGGRLHVRRIYRPTNEDMEVLRVSYPNDPSDCPVWSKIKAQLIDAGHTRTALEEAEAPLIILWVSKLKKVDTAAIQPKKSEKPETHYIDLDQAAAIVNRVKRSLERKLKEMPPPAVKGGKGKKSEWDYAILRPWLEKTYNKLLPTVPPHVGQ
jgi:hypothetical protein